MSAKEELEKLQAGLSALGPAATASLHPGIGPQRSTDPPPAVQGLFDRGGMQGPLGLRDLSEVWTGVGQLVQNMLQQSQGVKLVGTFQTPWGAFTVTHVITLLPLGVTSEPPPESQGCCCPSGQPGPQGPTGAA